MKKKDWFPAAVTVALFIGLIAGVTLNRQIKKK